MWAIIVSNNHYQLYIEKVLQLAETIVIHSIESAEALNNYIALIHGSDVVGTEDKRTWKYYKNIAGEYHAVDTPMYVKSADTLETILFSKEALALHRATARSYAYGTRQYRELVAQFPEQESLILGILYPVDIEKAVVAYEGEILGYPTGLVEENEYSLIPNLQKWINGYKGRWVNKQFGISDDLYPATSLGIMYLQLVPTIVNLRLAACKTNEAHSFHVRQYLASHGLLDPYLDSMTKKQALFFYRNIAYIERNVGKKEIFDWLVEHIMSERYLPIGEYTMRHDLSDQPNDLYPKLLFKKTPLNLGYGSDPNDKANLKQMLDKQDKMARDNVLYKDEALPTIREKMENSMSNVLPTKVLESAVVDMTNSSPYSMEDILLNHWIWLATQEMYTAVISVTNPATGERIPLTAKEAYTFMWYAYCKHIGIELDFIPQVLAKRVQRLPTPPQMFRSLSAAAVEPSPNPVAGSKEDLMSVVNPALVSEKIAEQALSMQPKIDSIISTEAFYEFCQQIYNAAQMQRHLVASQEHAVKRGMVHGMISRIYSDSIVDLEPEGTAYQDWFGERNIDVGNMSREDMGVLYQDLIREATGAALNDNSSLKSLQAAMTRMLAQLSSYSVQIIAEINNSNIRKTDWTVVRVGDIGGKGAMERTAPDMTVTVQDVKGRAKQEINVVMNGCNVKTTIKESAKTTKSLNIAVKPKWNRDRATVFHVYHRMSRICVRPQVKLQPNSRDIVPVMGLDLYLQLPEDKQQRYYDVYNGGYSPLPYEDKDPVINTDSEYMTPRYVTPNYSF